MALVTVRSPTSGSRRTPAPDCYSDRPTAGRVGVFFASVEQTSRVTGSIPVGSIGVNSLLTGGFRGFTSGLGLTPSTTLRLYARAMERRDGEPDRLKVLVEDDNGTSAAIEGLTTEDEQSSQPAKVAS